MAEQIVEGADPSDPSEVANRTFLKTLRGLRTTMDSSDPDAMCVATQVALQIGVARGEIGADAKRTAATLDRLGEK